jgi:hypothetical protein
VTVSDPTAVTTLHLMSQTVRPELVGTHRFTSRLFSNDWILTKEGGDPVARIHRVPSLHVSRVTFPDGGVLELRPSGWGSVVAEGEGDVEAARIDRESWWGRRWRVSGKGFEYELTSDHLPRRWTLRVGGHPVARLAGTVWSYNRVTVVPDFALPVHAVLLCWHVLARPWEAAATPRVLVPQPTSPASSAS